MSKSWIIKGNVPSSKNSRIWTGRKLIPSKSYWEYKEKAIPLFEQIKEEFLDYVKDKEKPLHIDFFFYRWTKHKADAHNLCLGPFDLMTETGLINDDNMDEVLSSFSGYSIVKKEDAGMKITVLDKKL